MPQFNERDHSPMYEESLGRLDVALTAIEPGVQIESKPEKPSERPFIHSSLYDDLTVLGNQ